MLAKNVLCTIVAITRFLNFKTTWFTDREL